MSDPVTPDPAAAETVMIVPARGGSRGIPRKNIRPLAGKPLIVWCLEAGLGCPEIGEILVATDDPAIRETVARWVPDPRVRCVARSPETATDTASTESVLLEVAATLDCRRLVLVQATSPLITAADLSAGLARIDAEGADSLVSVVRQTRFRWDPQPDGSVRPANYDPAARPRRQDFAGDLVENGAFYIFDRRRFLKAGTRLFGRIVAQEMPPATYHELDEPEDWPVIEALLHQRVGQAPLPTALARRIGLVLSDIDGVLTDAGMYYAEGGDELKKFNTYDGFGVARLRATGIPVGLITREDRALNGRRAAKLQVDHLAQGATDKVAVAAAWLDARGLDWGAVAYLGDDLHDLPLLRRVGLAVAPASARPEVRAQAHLVTACGGGEGCLRELAERLLAARGDGDTTPAPE